MLMCDVCIVTSCDCHITLLVCHPSLWLMSWCHITTPSPPVVHCGTTGGATYFSLEFLSFPLQLKKKKTIYAQFWVILFLRTTKVVLHLIGWPSHSAAWSLAACICTAINQKLNECDLLRIIYFLLIPVIQPDWPRHNHEEKGASQPQVDLFQSYKFLWTGPAIC